MILYAATAALVGGAGDHIYMTAAVGNKAADAAKGADAMDIDSGAITASKDSRTGGLAALGGDDALAEALYGDPTRLTEPIKTVHDKFALLPAFLKVC